ncbi:MAG TPA: hypothetical protein VHC90_18215 [Bryobacteraceae bacterium]|nr:hypothetical protein [Bryobacteraceae bacterium]
MKHAAFLAILIAAAFGMARGKVYHGPYGYDEADYMFAAGLGIADNWLDTGSMPLSEFVSVGRNRGADTSQKAGLSDLARSGADPVVYRHWHGPLYYFWLSAASRIGLDENGTRALFLIFPILTACAIYFGTLALFEGFQGQIAAVLASAMFLWSPIYLETSEIAPHMMFVLWAVCALLLLARVSLTGSRRCFYAATVLAALAFCTLEVAFVLILVLIFVAWWKRVMLRADGKLIRNSILLFFATVLLVWPSAILKLNFAKAYLVMAYLAVFRKGAWGDVTLGQTWARRFEMTPVELILIAAGLILFFTIMSRRDRTAGMPFLVFGLLMLLATLRVYSVIARYMTPFLPAFDILAGWALASALVRTKKPAAVYGVVAVTAVLLLWNAGQRLASIDRSAHPGDFATIDAVRARGLADKRVFVPRGEIPVLHYYFPQMQTVGYLALSDIPAGTAYAGIVYPDGRVESH